MIRGAFRHLIAIYRPDTYDIGNEVESWRLIGKPRSNIKVLENLESAGHDQQGVELVEFTIPYSKSLEFDYLDSIVVHRNKEYDVLGIKNIGYRDKELRITAKLYSNAPRLPNGTT